ncbi:tRNA (adenosine(37)-N6)-threonylcarbamoyltransferase complex dimerization subunit type 1 TsaB [Parapedobacter sp. SGR-10]|uniref:tRNA (adenosine(37)-N6)-threonylcarbamoyltransferase complex dimerization subunit type 1 TsaB n=1 Tax=Parapedobacter sp. SGR-10 TaxID=2710879 RepID=UPI0013D24ED6|nr:tRNA (adenosine(37)-N6)-threonylcarbamoyltransferase complex dimerization subunit type 1 TsaB [Parapedobacter sp. SGR-10]NGF55016.1 tRNA (adenosine(37)-N6)-threonylcarbamoyltransferase complex dimerization subunit type 1 TsaB [Parapedobacter sp. SGR-10]
MNTQYILQIDTATEVCSVSLSANGEVVDTVQTEVPNQHASRLTVFVEEILQRNDVAYTDLAAIAVSMGPGSYTGLRIGVSTAKGLCYSLDRPLIAVNTLKAMYDGYRRSVPSTSCDLYCPMIDARRMEVYMSVFDDEGGLISPTAAVIIDRDSFEVYKDKKIVLFGSGANKFAQLFEDDPTVTVDAGYKHSSAYMSEVVWQKYRKQDFEDLIYFEPFYLKEFVPTTPKK